MSESILKKYRIPDANVGGRNRNERRYLAADNKRLRAENTRLRDLLRRWRDCCACACAGAEDCYAEAKEVCGERD